MKRSQSYGKLYGSFLSWPTSIIFTYGAWHCYNLSDTAFCFWCLNPGSCIRYYGLSNIFPMYFPKLSTILWNTKEVIKEHQYPQHEGLAKNTNQWFHCWADKMFRSFTHPIISYNVKIVSVFSFKKSKKVCKY